MNQQLFSIGQTIAVTVQTTNGLGKPSMTLSDEAMQIVEKSGYAAVPYTL